MVGSGTGVDAVGLREDFGGDDRDRGDGHGGEERDDDDRLGRVARLRFERTLRACKMETVPEDLERALDDRELWEHHTPSFVGLRGIGQSPVRTWSMAG